jgi:hypothetical protein
MQAPVSTTESRTGALLLQTVFPPFFPASAPFGENRVCRVKCANWRTDKFPKRKCSLVLAVGGYVLDGDAKSVFLLAGFPAPKWALDRFGLTEAEGARRRRSRYTYLEVLRWTEHSVTIRCKCKAERRIIYNRVEELYLEKTLDDQPQVAIAQLLRLIYEGTPPGMPVDIWTSEL